MSTETTNEVLPSGIPMTGDTDILTEQVVETELGVKVLPVSTPRPNPADFVKRQKAREKPVRPVTKTNRHLEEDPDRYLLQAKALVVANYNEHRDPRRSPLLNTELVYISWFSKTIGSWKAVLGSTVVQGLLWEVSFNDATNEAYLDIFRRLNRVRIPLGK